MTMKEIDKQIYQSAKQFLLDIGINKEELDQEISTPYAIEKAKSLEGIFSRLLESGSNANMKWKVINGSIGGIDNLNEVLGDFNPQFVVDKYGDDHEMLLDEIIDKLNPKGKIRKTSRSLWPQFCKTILSGANFLIQFKDSNDFHNYVNVFYNDERSRAALPMIISKEISGIGFALGCDFLKELGYLEYPKPDVHLTDIFTALNLCDNDDDYSIYKAIIRLARNNDVTPFTADRVFWMIGKKEQKNNFIQMVTN